MVYNLMDHRNDVIKCSAREDSLSYCKMRYGNNVFIRISAHLPPTPTQTQISARYHPPKKE